MYKYFYILILILSIIVFVFLSYEMYSLIKCNAEKKIIYQLLAPIGILLSAFLASLSVLKNINNTNKIEEEKNKQKKLDSVKRLNIFLHDINESIEEIDENTNLHFTCLTSQLLKESRILIENDKEILSLDISEKLRKILFNIRRIEGFTNMLKAKDIDKLSTIKICDDDSLKTILQFRDEILKDMTFITNKLDIKFDK